VAWTCEDHGDEVLAELAGAARQAARTPRGRRPAAEVVALTLRFRPEEWSSVERTLRQAQSAARAPVTRTAVVAAALGVAVRRAAT
jgi:hypothetical protein